MDVYSDESQEIQASEPHACPYFKLFMGVLNMTMGRNNPIISNDTKYTRKSAEICPKSPILPLLKINWHTCVQEPNNNY